MTDTTIAVGDRVQKASNPNWQGTVRAVRGGDLFDIDWDRFAAFGNNPYASGELERIEPKPERNLNDLIADVTARSLDVAFSASSAGIRCVVEPYDPEDDSYYGDGCGDSPLLALEAALANGGAW